MLSNGYGYSNQSAISKNWKSTNGKGWGPSVIIILLSNNNEEVQFGSTFDPSNTIGCV